MRRTSRQPQTDSTLSGLVLWDRLPRVARFTRNPGLYDFQPFRLNWVIRRQFSQANAGLIPRRARDDGGCIQKARGAPVSRSAPLCCGRKPNSVPVRLLKAHRRWSFISRRDFSPPRGPAEAERMRPIPETDPGVSPATGQATRRLCLALHRMGFIVPRRLPPGRWAFTPPFHPYRNARTSASRRFILCDTFHRPELAPRSSAAFSAACCLVVFGLSSPAEARATIYPQGG